MCALCGVIILVQTAHHNMFHSVSTTTQARLGIASACWLCAQLHWLGWAYMLEFRGKNVFLHVWIASVLFFAASVALLCALLRASAPGLGVGGGAHGSGGVPAGITVGNKKAK